MNYGYARVSTKEQNEARQLAAFSAIGIATVFVDKGIDIQLDNVQTCRARLAAIATGAGVSADDAAFIFRRNIIHGDMLFFPMIARFYDWTNDTWTTLEQMTQ